MKLIKNKAIKILLSLIIPAFILLTQPLDMSLNQAITASGLILVLIWWTSKIINQSFASMFLLTIFLFFGDVSPKIVFRFVLSSNFYLIILSFLLSQAIVNSNIASRFSDFFLVKYCNTGIKLISMSFFLGFLLMFIIPHLISRVILLSSIYNNFLEKKEINNKTKQVLIYSVFISSITWSMFMLNGDVVLNYALFQIADTSISSTKWLIYMAIPTLLTLLLFYFSYIFTWKKNLKNVNFKSNKIENVGKLTKDEKIVIIVMVIAAIMWITERFHGINSAIVALIATLIFFRFKTISKKDLKTININLMIFLVAALSIGKVMDNSGIADKVYSELLNIFSVSENDNILVLTIILITMSLHMVLGSTVTTISVVAPGLIELTEGRIELTALMFLIYISVNTHYILPFHKATVMVGLGKYYDSKIIFKFGLILTILVFVVIFCFYVPWWKLIRILS